jgi:hypothetical protein
LTGTTNAWKGESRFTWKKKKNPIYSKGLNECTSLLCMPVEGHIRAKHGCIEIHIRRENASKTTTTTTTTTTTKERDPTRRLEKTYTCCCCCSCFS